MSYHIDRKEFDEAVEEKDWEFIWSAYEYAINCGGEGMDNGRCISKHDITNAVIQNINPRLLDTVTVVDDWRCGVSIGEFQLVVILKWWVRYVGLGLVHWWYRRKLQKLCNERVAVNIRGVVVVR